MKNINIIAGFMSGDWNKSRSVSATGNDLYSYSTNIVHIDTNTLPVTVWLNMTKYSVTTSKMQTQVLNRLDSLCIRYPNFTVNIVNDIPLGCSNIAQPDNIRQSLPITSACTEDINLIVDLCYKYKK